MYTIAGGGLKGGWGDSCSRLCVVHENILQNKYYNNFRIFPHTNKHKAHYWTWTEWLFEGSLINDEN